jgi:hypothetical protein
LAKPLDKFVNLFQFTYSNDRNVSVSLLPRNGEMFVGLQVACPQA